MGIWYATREDVKSALDYKETARNNAQIDRAIENASRRVEDLTHRKFYPTLATRYFDWPNYQRTYAWKLYLDANEAITLTTVTSAGTAIAPTDYLLRRSDNVDEPPYNTLEINLASSASFLSSTTFQRQIALTGTFGASAYLDAAGALSAAITTTSATTCAVTDSSLVGVGDLVLVGTEYMTVSNKTSADTGVTIFSNPLAAQTNATTVLLSASGVNVGEVITVDSERMLVTDVTGGQTLTVQRAWDGSTLATHAVLGNVYAPRTLTVTRGAAGSTAATHSVSAAVQKNRPPGLINELTLAYALDALQQKQTAYARTVGSGDGTRNASGSALKALEDATANRHKRTRFGAI